MTRLGTPTRTFSISIDTLSNAIKRFREEKDIYLKAAMECADKYCNMDLHMGKVLPRIKAILDI
jgi:hypothetical protein